MVTNLHGSHLTEHSQVLGHLWLGEPELPHEVVHRPFPAREDVENQPPPGLGHGVESVGGGRCSCHVEIIYRYRNMSRSKQSGFAGTLSGG